MKCGSLDLLFLKSAVHDQEIKLNLFDRFLRSQLRDIAETNGEHSPHTRHAAQLVESGVDLRLFNYDEQEGHLGAWRWHMHSTYLPLASHTQFVETAVKEAKNVSATDRSEQIRTCLAVIRSSASLGKEREDSNKKKMLAIIQSARDRTEPHNAQRETQVDRKCDQRFNTLLHAITKQGHFKNKRIDVKKLKVDDQGSKCKKQNMSQQTKQQHMTSAVTGLMLCTKATIKRNVEDAFTEIRFRQWQLNYQAPMPNCNTLICL